MVLLVLLLLVLLLLILLLLLLVRLPATVCAAAAAAAATAPATATTSAPAPAATVGGEDSTDVMMLRAVRLAVTADVVVVQTSKQTTYRRARRLWTAGAPSRPDVEADYVQARS